ncbi:hypothetical protein ES703_41427 [subsurface metagenome]
MDATISLRLARSMLIRMMAGEDHGLSPTGTCDSSSRYFFRSIMSGAGACELESEGQNDNSNCQLSRTALGAITNIRLFETSSISWAITATAVRVLPEPVGAMSCQYGLSSLSIKPAANSAWNGSNPLARKYSRLAFLAILHNFPTCFKFSDSYQ